MSLKPKVTTTEELLGQIQELESKHTDLETKRNGLQEHFGKIMQVIEENAALESKGRALINDFMTLQRNEWEKSKECYPEIRMGILKKVIDLQSGS